MQLLTVLTITLGAFVASSALGAPIDATQVDATAIKPKKHKHCHGKPHCYPVDDNDTNDSNDISPYNFKFKNSSVTDETTNSQQKRYQPRNEQLEQVQSAEKDPNRQNLVDHPTRPPHRCPIKRPNCHGGGSSGPSEEGVVNEKRGSIINLNPKYKPKPKSKPKSKGKGKPIRPCPKGKPGCNVEASASEQEGEMLRERDIVDEKWPYSPPPRPRPCKHGAPHCPIESDSSENVVLKKRVFEHGPPFNAPAHHPQPQPQPQPQPHPIPKPGPHRPPPHHDCPVGKPDCKPGQETSE